VIFFIDTGQGLKFTGWRAGMVLQNQPVRPGVCTHGFNRLEDPGTKKRIRFGLEPNSRA
jgi:hypothetical protein